MSTAPNIVPMRRGRLQIVRPEPVVLTKRPLISSEAQRTEAKGERFYPRTNLKPKELPATYRILAAYRRRMPLRRWLRWPAAVGLGCIVIFGARVCGMHGIGAMSVGVVAALGAWAMEGWRHG